MTNPTFLTTNLQQKLWHNLELKTTFTKLNLDQASSSNSFVKIQSQHKVWNSISKTNIPCFPLLSALDGKKGEDSINYGGKGVLLLQLTLIYEMLFLL